MDRSTPGGAGVLRWADSIRLAIAKDPGRQLLHDQIQNTFDFLDDYMENVLKGPRTESVRNYLRHLVVGRTRPRVRGTRRLQLRRRGSRCH
ncbi:uncharacterized protein B0H18DRAFT_674295 [Fomitopsis serialis]|uniref:uncharacterized protein n=1 Tax=Fomitopsis serialis TaxID=139415 RepID=UPI002008BB8B|nr:uncharacterized protein B0H18DRAFT_674295 [Neoantrodia serialis]KAH9933007.1 hypothetical protein B0H18DRAFT_674295 [Neoantrodia serialis]